MTLKTREEWREAIIQHEIKRIRDGGHELDCVAETMTRLPEVEESMVPLVLDVAVQFWLAWVFDPRAQAVFDKHWLSPERARSEVDAGEVKSNSDGGSPS